MPQTPKADLVLIHSDDEHKEASGGWIEYDITTSYLYDPKAKQVIRRIESSCDNTRDRKKGWDNRLDSEKIVTTDQLPPEVREKLLDHVFGKKRPPQGL